MKKILILFLLACIVVFVWMILGMISNKNLRPTVPVVATPTPYPVSAKRITVSGVEMNDFFASPKRIDSKGDVAFEETQDYQLVYIKPFNYFIVSVLGSPFEEARSKAEIAFLNSLGVSKEDACKLDVVVNTPSFANPDFAGKDYPLSFCINNQ